VSRSLDSLWCRLGLLKAGPPLFGFDSAPRWVVGEMAGQGPGDKKEGPTWPIGLHNWFVKLEVRQRGRRKAKGARGSSGREKNPRVEGDREGGIQNNKCQKD